ncbi:AbrB/MazE/SpoVT family DNA-binding domain-containing protein [Sphingomonas gei]|uniref:AbrB/MazE/SpoVT family DNA-binding domain-containing protein n=1 Tax=Sphingomonas gei TaxID=1395960 RepID=A0A4S1X8A0_9SPHN|nr:AbrB/MazE/SpoVT family DNA-binding domain-containing protein [Sphingomonas gei]TGX52341.1 AbrB/MazE/SpoVT family DNA-binding domain-containing protein [Sphingomonas gei]
MTKEYRAKTFKSGNSLALRLPKGLGIREGQEMVLREDRGKFAFEPAPKEGRKIDLTGIYGSMPNLSRMPVDEADRDWSSDSRRD